MAKGQRAGRNNHVTLFSRVGRVPLTPVLRFFGRARRDGGDCARRRDHVGLRLSVNKTTATSKLLPQNLLEQT